MQKGCRVGPSWPRPTEPATGSSLVGPSDRQADRANASPSLGQRGPALSGENVVPTSDSCCAVSSRVFHCSSPRRSVLLVQVGSPHRRIKLSRTEQGHWDLGIEIKKAFWGRGERGESTNCAVGSECTACLHLAQQHTTRDSQQEARKGSSYLSQF